MRDIVTALFSVLPRLGSIACLLGLIFYIFSVLFTELFGDLVLTEDYFSTLERSLLTMFQMMTLDWASIMRECMAQIWWAWVPFVVFIMITGFIVYNLIIAVVCEAVAAIGESTDQERSKEKDADKRMNSEADFDEFLDSVSQKIKVEEK